MYLTSKTTGASTNYSLSSSSTFDSNNFSSPSFTSSNSGSTLTRGHDQGATTYDSGTVWVTINGVQYSTSYGEGNTTSTVASALTSAINADGTAVVTASVSGSTITLTAKTGGVNTDYSLSAGSSTTQGSFSSPSFTTSTSGSTLAGGGDASIGTIYYYVEDMLGRPRTIVQAGQSNPCFDADFYPYGGEHDVTDSCPQNYKFEGKERDSETQNDDFGARYYTWRLGRWLSADWSAIPEPVPYANLTNPQTLNLYAMVSDNPETFADLNGHSGEQLSNTTASDPTDSANGNKCTPGDAACTAGRQQQAQQQNGNNSDRDNDKGTPAVQSGAGKGGKGGGQGKGERRQTSKPEGTPSPTKGVQPVRDKNGNIVGWSLPSPDGKRVRKTLDWGKANGLNPADFKKVAVGAAAGAAVGIAATLGEVLKDAAAACALGVCY